MSDDDGVRDRLHSVRGGVAVTLSNDRQQNIPPADNGSATFQRGLELIYRNTKAIVALEQRSAMDRTSNPQTGRQLDAIMTKTRTAALKMKFWLDKEEGKVSAMEQASTAGNTVVQMKRNRLRTYSTKFQDAMIEFGNVSEHFRDVLKGQIERQARMVKSNISDGQMKKLLSGKESAPQMFEAAVNRNEQLVDVVDEIEHHQDGMHAIHDGIKDLQEMFVDMKLLVDDQQENLNMIEGNVLGAAEQAQAGRVNMDKALAYSQQARRRKCYLYLIILIVIGIIAAVILSQKGVL
uniref:t-SNARE coiled-coil homology domain-containing protein n=1 Tax=Spongospora subterranea TaxID=70186 RepID=A0A0H5RTL6_9EUKA|eukprot:CRZ12084.1 hypothetical protein [Spongospora subterranea]